MIGRSGERGSGISVLAARLGDDDEINTYTETFINESNFCIKCSIRN